MYTTLVRFVGLFMVLVSYADAVCRNLIFAAPFQGRRLVCKGALISVSEIESAEPKASCELICWPVAKCVAFNVVCLSKNKYRCELLRLDRHKDSCNSLEENQTSVYVELTNNPCRQSPCLYGVCQVDSMESYQCVCDKGFTGVNCDADVDECENGNHTCNRVNGTCVNTLGSYKCTCKLDFVGDGRTCLKKPVENCADVLKKGGEENGIYTLLAERGNDTFKVYCDQKTTGGGWTVFQRRQDGSVDFYRGWQDYKTGFGNLTGEFWLGLDTIHRLAHHSGVDMVLRVELEDFENDTRFAEYTIFAVSSEEEKYKLTVRGYSGNAGDSMNIHDGQAFSTKDVDNDISPDRSCAVIYKGAWWHHNCLRSSLNGRYHNTSSNQYAEGIIWYTWKRFYYSLRKAEMKIRPKES